MARAAEGLNGSPKGVEREEKSFAKERRSCIRRGAGREFWVWDETAVGAARDDAPVSVQGGCYSEHPDSICRTAVYVTRMHGGVGGGHREVFPYPEWASPISHAVRIYRASGR